MTQEEIDVVAKGLYDACLTPKQTWEQSGEVTKSVWREYALLKIFADLV